MSPHGASNWVDRGEPVTQHLSRVLRRFFGLDRQAEPDWLAEQARVVLAMVEADASEVQVASYLGHLEQTRGRAVSPGPERRLVAVALWHIGKAGLMREQLARLVAQGIPRPTSDTVALEPWLRERLLRADPRDPTS